MDFITPFYNDFDATSLITPVRNKSISGEVGFSNINASFDDPEGDTPSKGIKVPKGLKRIIIKSVIIFNKRRRPLTD